MFSRRKTLQALGAGALGIASSTLPGMQIFAQQAAGFSNTLKIPELYAGELNEDSRLFRLTLQTSTTEFFSGIESPTLGINSSYLGPTLHFTRGEDISLHVQNQIGEVSTLHWHGFHLPAKQDGGPLQPIAAGGNWTPGFTVLQNAGTYWYHSHLLHSSGEQVYRGIAGMIVVDDDESLRLGLPSKYGIDDIPLIVQDRQFNADASFRYMSRYKDSVMGMHGDVILVNGTVNPVFSPSTKLVRFRILNAANAKTFSFAFSDGRQFQQIASDGGFLERPVTLEELELAPAERAEIVVDFSDGQDVTLLSLPKPPSFPQFQGAMSEMMRELNTQGFDILSIRPQANPDDTSVVPASLTSILRLRESDAVNTRTFRLSMGFGTRSGDDAGPGRGARNGLGGGYGGGNYSINGRKMADTYINARITVGTTEIWELYNNSPMMHPFHVHNGQFQILDRNGSQPHPNEQGWKDTVKVESGQSLRLIMRFDDFTDSESAYMYHCHILEHEDLGMMGQFLVVDR